MLAAATRAVKILRIVSPPTTMGQSPPLIGKCRLNDYSREYGYLQAKIRPATTKLKHHSFPPPGLSITRQAPVACTSHAFHQQCSFAISPRANCTFGRHDRKRRTQGTRRTTIMLLLWKTTAPENWQFPATAVAADRGDTCEELEAMNGLARGSDMMQTHHDVHL